MPSLTEDFSKVKKFKMENSVSPPPYYTTLDSSPMEMVPLCICLLLSLLLHEG